MRYQFIFVLIFSRAFCPATSYAQDEIQYPDSMRAVVLKIEPLSFLYNHVGAGVEIPLKNSRFIDVTVGIPNVGFSQHQIAPGGFLFKAGLKYPFRLRSPFSIVYLMPELIYDRYNQFSDYYYTYTQTVRQSVTATAILLCFGYRHVNPSTKFYYDIGFDLGYGWVNNSDATMNMNFILLTSGYSYSPTSSISAAAISCHFSVGFLLKRKKR